MQSAQKPTSPLKRLALHSTTTCSSQAAAYGKCIAATYSDVRKDCCKHEFEKFGQCLRQAVRPQSVHAPPLT
ncbi:hypothetical protein HD554DRAFT_2020084 [Boletus coccyginus]|nr:hypothetical protein HD554DRAFT_2020084 [Boletus coccyginus]